MKSPDANEIIQAITKSYISLAEPDFHFVSRQLSMRPYDRLVKSLKQRFEIEELTDPNDDVAFFYALRIADLTWVLGLSMLGPYAVVLPKISEKKYQPIAPGAPSGVEEEYLLEELVSHGVALIEQDLLELPIAIKLQNTSPERACVYHALFTDSEVLPWSAGRQPTATPAWRR